MHVSSVTQFPIRAGDAGSVSKPPEPKADPNHDSDNDATASKAPAPGTDGKSQSRLDITA